jgi:hypothetical protein
VQDIYISQEHSNEVELVHVVVHNQENHRHPPGNRDTDSSLTYRPVKRDK